jgi:L-iditol 2-dehydrogenase
MLKANIPGEMRAIIWEGIGKVSLHKRPIPVPGRGEVLIQVLYNGLCSTDYPIVQGEVDGSWPGMLIGHEPVGRVIGLGEGVTFPPLGARVALDTMLACGKCRFCHEGHPELCVASDEIGFSVDGNFSDYAVHPAANWHVLPEAVDDLTGTLIEALTCQLGAVDSLNVAFGESVAIVGSGLAALNFIQLMRLKGAGHIALSMFPIQERMDLAVQLGADQVISDGNLDTLRQQPKIQAEDGFDVVVDAVGTQEAALAALSLARRGGKVLLYGLNKAVINDFPLGSTIFRNLTLYGRTSAPHAWETAIDLVARGAIRLGEMVGEVVELEDVPRLLTVDSAQRRPLKRVVRVGSSPRQI